MAEIKEPYRIDNDNRIVYAIVERLKGKSLQRVKTLIDLGYALIPEEPPKKVKKEDSLLTEKNIQEFLKVKATKEQQDTYWEKYNEQATDKKTGRPAVYKTNSTAKSKGTFKKGEPKPKGHVATLAWFKNTFPNYEKDMKELLKK